jgi:hypothetical protein
MDAPACAVGRLRPGGRWVGFAPTLDDGYALVVGGAGGTMRADADADVLLALAIAYFEEALDAPPDDLAATHGDVAGLMRHLAAAEIDVLRRRRLDEAVDAIDDGLAADVVIGRLASALAAPWSEDPTARLIERAQALSGND